MYRKIMVPIDLAHVEQLGKAIDTATDIAKLYKVPVCFVGVTAETPTSVAHTPEEYARKLAAYGSEQAATHGIRIETVSHPSHDPTVELDRILMKAADETGADLIVMASHVPGFAEHFFASHAGDIASHAKISVFVVR